MLVGTVDAEMDASTRRTTAPRLGLDRGVVISLLCRTRLAFGFFSARFHFSLTCFERGFDRELAVRWINPFRKTGTVVATTSNFSCELADNWRTNQARRRARQRRGERAQRLVETSAEKFVVARRHDRGGELRAEHGNGPERRVALAQLRRRQRRLAARPRLRRERLRPDGVHAVRQGVVSRPRCAVDNCSVGMDVGRDAGEPRPTIHL